MDDCNIGGMSLDEARNVLLRERRRLWANHRFACPCDVCNDFRNDPHDPAVRHLDVTGSARLPEEPVGPPSVSLMILRGLSDRTALHGFGEDDDGR